MRILILDTDDAFRESLSDTIRGAGHSVVTVRDRAEASSLCSPDNCDLVFLDPANQPEVLPDIREHNPEMPVVIMSENPTIESVIAALRLGTFDYLIKPFDEISLKEALERARRSIEVVSNQRAYLKRILKTFSELSFAQEKIRECGFVVDGGQEYYYSHFFEDILAIELARSQRFNYNFTIISIRLAYLQHYMSPEKSAEFGSQVEAVSDFLHQRVRRTDILTRTGINEFMIILVETPKEGGIVVAETLLQGLAAIIPADLRMTWLPEEEAPLSVGTASYPLDGMECQELIQKACHCNNERIRHVH